MFVLGRMREERERELNR
jgi:U4/U6.U5 tri-snRNP-associated protein 1